MTIQVGDQRSSGFGLLKVAVIAVVRYSKGMEEEIRHAINDEVAYQCLSFGAKKTDDLN